jgi:hypothetical protein
VSSLLCKVSIDVKRGFLRLGWRWNMLTKGAQRDIIYTPFAA